MTEQPSLFDDPAPAQLGAVRYLPTINGLKVPTDADATIDATGTYRYRLSRTWALDKPVAELRILPWLMLNPSTADGRQDDPTIGRVNAFTYAWGYDGHVVLNLHAYRATQPADMWAAASRGVDIIGPDNDLRFALAGREVVCAWGADPRAAGRGQLVRDELVAAGCRVLHLGLTKGGHPRHPLYLPGNTTPTPWEES